MDSLRRADDLKGPPSPTSKVTKWLGTGGRKKNEPRKTEHVPTSATANLNKLRARLLAIRNDTGSFSSNGSERIAPDTGNSVSSNTDEAVNSSKEAWRISAQSSPEKDADISTKNPQDYPAAAVARAPVSPLISKPQAGPSGRKAPYSANLPPRSPPRRSSTRFNPQPSPRTPSRTPPTNSSFNTPRQNGSWMDEQLSVLDRLSKQLSITASQLSEDSPEKQRPVVQQKNRRSSVADWQKYQDLAAQLEIARSQLENLESSDDEVSFAALIEDK